MTSFSVTPPDPQGAGTRVAKLVEWRNVYEADPSRSFFHAGFTTSHATREDADLDAKYWVERYSLTRRLEKLTHVTTTTITRYPIPPHAGEETKG